MRLASLALLFWLITLAAATGRAGAKDDAKSKGAKLGELIEKYNATKKDDLRGGMAEEIAALDVPESYAFVGKILREDRSYQVKLRTSQVLNGLGAKAKPVVPDLVFAAKTVGFRVNALKTLQCIGPGAKEALPDILAYLKDKTLFIDFRCAAAAAVGGIMDPKEADPILKETMQDKDPALRIACAKSLYRIDKANAKIIVAACQEALKKSPYRILALTELEALGPDAKDAASDLVNQDWPDRYTGDNSAFMANRALLSLGKEALPALLEGAKSKQPLVSDRATTFLRKQFPDEAMKAGLGSIKEELEAMKKLDVPKELKGTGWCFMASANATVAKSNTGSLDGSRITTLAFSEEKVDWGQLQSMTDKAGPAKKSDPPKSGKKAAPSGTAKKADQADSGKYTADPAANPCRIEMTQGKTTFKGIYAMKKTKEGYVTLELQFSAAGGDYPKELFKGDGRNFAVPKDSKEMMFVFIRVK